MLRHATFVLALLCSAVALPAQFNFLGISTDKPCLVEMRFGQPVLIIVDVNPRNGEAMFHWDGSGQMNLRLREIGILDARPCIAGTSFMLHGTAIDGGAPYAWVPDIQPGVSFYRPSYSWWLPGGFFGIGEACLYYCTEHDPGRRIYRGPCGSDCNTHAPQAYAAVFDVRLR